MCSQSFKSDFLFLHLKLFCSSLKLFSIALPHHDTEFTNNYSITCLLPDLNLFPSHNVLIKHCFPNLYALFLKHKTSHFSVVKQIVQDSVQFISKQVTTFPSLLVVSLIALTLNLCVIKIVVYVLLLRCSKIRSMSAWHNNA